MQAWAKFLTPSLRMWGKQARARVRKDKDLVIAICSCLEEGAGKSTLAIWFGLATDDNFNLRDNELYAPTEQEAKDKILNLPRYATIIADEAIKILYKLRWASSLQVFLNTLFALSRKENKITVLCMPRFRDFNEFFRNHKIKIWIEIIERGTGVVFAKDWSPFAKDPWWIDENQKLVDKARKNRKFTEYNTEEKLSILSKSKNYVGVIKWDDLPQEIKDEYIAQRDAIKYKGLDNIKDKRSEREARYSKAFSLLIGLLKFMGLPESFIARITGFSQQQINYIARQHSEDIKEALREVDNETITKLLNKKV